MFFVNKSLPSHNFFGLQSFIKIRF
jgi:hypothetical protein